MSSHEFIGVRRHREWLTSGPLGPIARQYLEQMQSERYSRLTIGHYLSALAHFSYWARAKSLAVSNINQAAVSEFIERHLPVCTCPTPCFRGHIEAHAALRRALVLLRRDGWIESTAQAPTPIVAELQRFQHYLTRTCGLASSTCSSRVRLVRPFLEAHFGVGPVELAHLSPQRIDDWIIGLTHRYRPGSFGVIRTSLRSYCRYRVLCGDSTEWLVAALPALPCWGETKLIRTLTDVQLGRFLRSFDLSGATGLRDRAMALCLSDLGLRAQEVIQLTLDDVNWRSGTVTLRKTKSHRARVLPLPATTGAAIAQYLRKGRPRTGLRRVFVRHVAPFEKPLARHAAADAMNRTFVRSGLRNQFSGTHVLRRTFATRLQRRGSSLKAIADLLGHQQLQTTARYAKVDFEQLRRVALPWAGRQS